MTIELKRQGNLILVNLSLPLKNKLNGDEEAQMESTRMLGLRLEHEEFQLRPIKMTRMEVW